VSELRSRLERVQRALAEQAIDLLLLGPSTDLLYLTGYAVKPSERLTLLAIAPEGTPRMVTPDFELPEVEALGIELEPVPWSDGDHAAATALKALGGRGMSVAVGAQLHARFLLDLLAAGLEADLLPGDRIMAPVRAVKSPAEVEALRHASSAADAVFEDLSSTTFAGARELEVVDRIRELLASHGNDATGSGLAAFGENSAAPHHHPSGRVARDGDAVIVDYGGTVRQYRADITRMFHVGEPTGEFQQVYEIVDAANQAAFEAAAPGVPAEAIDAAARMVIEEAGFGDRFLHRTGHGIGLDVHEPPYLVRGNTDPLAAGMAFTIEPGIYLEDRFGVRIEDVVVVTEDGAERLNVSSHALRVVS
jgi:Xaa-Pro aminopeptidase